MPRNGSGTFTTPNSFSAGETISSAKVNANSSDVATALTGSLPRDGQAGMTGQLKAANGTAGAPGMSFASDTDSGFYRISGDEIGLALGGDKVAGFTSDGIDVVGTIKQNSEALAFPSGTIMLFQQTSAPTGWTKQTTHNNKALRIVSGTAGSGGSLAFTTAFQGRTIGKTNLPNITLTGSTNTTGAHSHPYTKPTNGTGGDGGSSVVDDSTTANTVAAGAHDHTVSVPLGGSGTPLDFDVQYVDLIIAQKD